MALLASSRSFAAFEARRGSSYASTSASYLSTSSRKSWTFLFFSHAPKQDLPLRDLVEEAGVLGIEPLQVVMRARSEVHGRRAPGGERGSNTGTGVTPQATRQVR